MVPDHVLSKGISGSTDFSAQLANNPWVVFYVVCLNMSGHILPRFAHMAALCASELVRTNGHNLGMDRPIQGLIA
jgi:hypothetical protein